MKNQNLFSIPYFRIGYFISLFGSFLILLWIGAFKFTPTEAKTIQPLLESHPLFSWVYNFFSVQTVSDFIGIFEITTSVLLILSLKFSKIKIWVGFGMLITFLVTLSFLLTSPETLHFVNGFPTVDFFILKDLLFLGFGLMLIGLPSNFFKLNNF